MTPERLAELLAYPYRYTVTIMNIDFDTIAAGPELDRLVAEKVMGWAITTDPFGVIKAGCNRYIVSHDIGQGDLEDLAFKPSVNIAHAWEVVGRLESLGFRSLVDSASGQGWVCWFAKRSEYPHGERPFGMGDTAVLAICRAALKAVR